MSLVFKAFGFSCASSWRIPNWHTLQKRLQLLAVSFACGAELLSQPIQQVQSTLALLSQAMVKWPFQCSFTGMPSGSSFSASALLYMVASSSTSTSPLPSSGGFECTMSFSLCGLGGIDEYFSGTGSEGRNASVSCTVLLCLARASERVKASSHSSAGKRWLAPFRPSAIQRTYPTKPLEGRRIRALTMAVTGSKNDGLYMGQKGALHLIYV